MVVLLSVLLNKCHLLLVLVKLVLLISDQITKLHLLLYQVFSLGKGADELFSFLFLEIQGVLLVSDVDSLQILFLELKLHLLVTEFFTKTLFFFVQVQEDLNVSIELLFLFSLYDFLDIPLFHNFHLALF